MRLQLIARPDLPDFLDLPWSTPLEEWDVENLVEVPSGIHRNVVRFVEYGQTIFALKELPERLARREYRLLRDLDEAGVPVVEVVGVVTDRGETRDDLNAILVTQHLEFSLPYRILFTGRGVPDLRTSLLDALAELLVRIHLAGFFWGDCSLSNTLFRRDAGTLSAYLVDAETGELHAKLTDGQRAHDLVVATENVGGELMDLEAATDGLPYDIDPLEVADEISRLYEALWIEVTHDEVFGPEENYKIDERLRRLNELGYDVEEVELVGDGQRHRLRFDPCVVEAGHHRRRLLTLTGLDVQENQARRLLNDIARYRASLALSGTRPHEAVAAYRWLAEIFEPTIAAVPHELRGKREPAQLFHEILDHRWFLSEAAGRDVGLDTAVASYVQNVLAHAPDERAVLEDVVIGEDVEEAEEDEVF
jgi:tRNA A-37 threonylcarbamoyl transferase component Bud32